MTQDNKKDHIAKIQKYISENYDIRLNEISFTMEIKKKKDHKWEELTDTIKADLGLYVQQNICKRNVDKDIERLIRSSRIKKIYNPIVQYFDNITYKWNEGDKDYIKEFCSSIISTQSQEFIYSHLLKHLVRMVRCGYSSRNVNDPRGHANRFIVVLQGAQNKGKTTLIRKLIPKELKDMYTESISFSDREKTDRLLFENFGINIDEIGKYNKDELDTFKNALSKDTVKVRLTYAKKYTIHTRLGNFWATTNYSQFLTDVTGSTRFIVFPCTDIKYEIYNQIDIDKIWAQALYYYKQYLKGEFNCDLNKEEQRINELNNEQFYIRGEDVEFIRSHFRIGTKDNCDKELTPTEISKFAKVCFNQNLRPNLIGKALVQEKFKSRSKRLSKDANPIYVYPILFHEGENGKIARNYFESF